MKTCKILKIGLCKTAMAVILAMASGTSMAQVTAPGFQSKPMLVAPISDVENKEVAIIKVAIQPGGASPLHTHPGDCYGAILEGNVELVLEGGEPRQFSEGQAWHNPRGPAHYFKNVGDKPVLMTNILVVDKGKPRTEVIKK
ncbi:MAG: cupin domain-containing protein [Rhodocyclaceae bacterium]|jgi:quercetin dioxygenase-like cupin family protein|nr:cupin domain-containing protein [Rhodocyclaceae bacterium]